MFNLQLTNSYENSLLLCHNKIPLPVASSLVESIHTFRKLAGQEIGILVYVHGIGHVAVQEALVVLGNLVLVVAVDLKAQLLLMIASVSLLMGELQEKTINALELVFRKQLHWKQI